MGSYTSSRSAQLAPWSANGDLRGAARARRRGAAWGGPGRRAAAGAAGSRCVLARAAGTAALPASSAQRPTSSPHPPSAHLPKSTTAVTPRASAYAAAARTASRRRATLGGGAAADTSRIAASRKIPVGAPPGPRSMEPSGGSGVPLSTPASAIAAELASAMCESMRCSSAGRPPAGPSSQDASGSAPPHRLSARARPGVRVRAGVGGVDA
jgi:hypothetical protein